MAPFGHALIFLFFCCASSFAEQRQVLLGHVPPAVSGLKPVGRLAGTNRLSLEIGLPLRNTQELTNFLQCLYNPTHPLYHHYLTPSQFTSNFGPTELEYGKVRSFAEAHGFVVANAYSNRVLLDVTASVADIEDAFRITMRIYQHPTEARTFYAPDSDPSVDSTLTVSGISGLDNYALPRPVSQQRKLHGKKDGAIPAIGSGQGGAYMASDIRAAYVPGVTLTGSGQKLALVEFDSYYANDILAYEASNGIPDVPLTNVLVEAGTGDYSYYPQPGYSGIPGAVDEVSLDIEMAMAMAPGLSQILVYEGSSPLQYCGAVLSRIAIDDLATQISCSWGWGLGANYPYGRATEGIIQQFAAQGQSFFIGSGDWGAYWDNEHGFADVGHDWLLTSPYATLTGGTTLTTTAPGGSWSSEQVWNEGEGVGISSGSISSSYAIPFWQQGIDMSSSGGSTTMRNTPDVAMVAEGIFAIANNGQISLDAGGTSAAAPLWAGLTALVNQQASMQGQPPVGFLNPALYAIGTSSNYALCFHDITVGNNTNSYCPTNFLAVPGYDLCTGLGTPIGSNLINALAPPDPLNIFPLAGLVSSGFAGGPFAPASESFYVTNSGAPQINWAVGNTPNWLDISPAFGALDPNTQAVIIVSPNAAAGTLPTGVYYSTLWFTNLSTGVAFNRQFTLLAGQLVQNGDFEDGYFDWSPSESSVSSGAFDGYFNQLILLPPFYAPYGVTPITLFEGNALEFANSTVVDISQSLPTSPAQPYLVSFWLGADFFGGTNDITVSWDGNVVCSEQFSDFDESYDNWTNIQLIVVASGSNTVLQFGFQVDDTDIAGYTAGYLGGITVTPIPVPVLQPAIQMNGILTLTWNSTTNARYQLQYTTDLNSAAWFNLGNPITATNSIVTACDAIASDPRRFYRVVLLQ
jgi:subtilase family serine protease